MEKLPEDNYSAPGFMILRDKINEIIDYIEKNQSPIVMGNFTSDLTDWKASGSTLSPENCLHDTYYVLNKKYGTLKCRECHRVFKRTVA